MKKDILSVAFLVCAIYIMGTAYSKSVEPMRQEEAKLRKELNKISDEKRDLRNYMYNLHDSLYEEFIRQKSLVIFADGKNTQAHQDKAKILFYQMQSRERELKDSARVVYTDLENRQDSIYARINELNKRIH